MKYHKLPSLPRGIRGSLLSSIGVILFGVLASALNAQTTPAAPAGPDETAAADKPEGGVYRLNEFVVTGSVTPRSKLESPLAITTLDRAKINDLAPRSLSEMLKAIPGVTTESSGGEAFASVSIRGIGTTAGYTYEVVQEDGLPVFSESNIRHGLADMWTPLSTFILNVEALRGGSSGVFATNATLGLFNFITREGGPIMQGEAALTTSDYGTLRSDIWASGPIGPNTTFALGAWYRVDDGPRYPGYTANRGGQVTGNVKHTFANGKGYVKGSFKSLNNHNTFDLPMPLQNAFSPHAIAGGPSMKDRNTSTTFSSDLRRLTLAGHPARTINFDLADGIFGKMNYFGTEIEYQLADGIKLQNRNRYTDGFRSIDYPFNGAAGVTWQTVANNQGRKDTAQFAAALNPATNNYAFRLSYPGQRGAAAPLGNNLSDAKAWQHSDGALSDIQNDLRVLTTFNDDKTTVTGGLYSSFLRNAQNYYFNTVLTDVTPQFRRVDITLVDATMGADIGPVTFNGILQFANQFRNDKSESREVSPYLVVEHKLGRLHLDAGVRHTSLRTIGTIEQTVATLNLSATNPALRGGRVGTGNFITNTGQQSDNAWTVGALCTFNRNLATFVRYSRAVRLIGLTDFLESVQANQVQRPIQHTVTFEAGVKYGTARLNVNLTAFRVELTDQFFTTVLFDPLTGVLGAPVVTTRAITNNGVEAEVIWAPVRGLSLGVNGVLNDPKFVSNNFVTLTRFDGTRTAVNENGHTPQRAAKVAANFTASYRFPDMAWGTLSVNGAYQWLGKRFADDIGSEPSPLQAFGEATAGIAFATKNRFNLRISVNNLLGSVGLSEGDARSGSTTSADPSTTFFNARPALPRTITGTVSYAF